MQQQDVTKAVWDIIEADTDYVTGLTRDLVKIPSVNPKFFEDSEQNREADVQKRLGSELEALGFDCEQWDVFPGRPNLAATIAGNEERSLILCGHVDTVPVGEKSKWTVDPFGGDIKDGKLYGRGSLDMKGGIAACIAAYAAIRKAGVRLDGRLSIHAVVDEEAGGFGAMDAVAKGKLAKAALIAEPTWGDILPCEGGLHWVRLTIKGRQGHAGWRFNEVWPQPDSPDRILPGVNAIELATRFLNALRDYESIRCRTTHHPLAPPGLNTINPGAIRGGAGLGLDGLPMVMTNPAIIPDIAVLDLDFKFLPNEAPEDVRAEFEAFIHHFCQQDRWLRDNPISIDWYLADLYFPPMDTPVDHPIVASLSKHKTAMGRPFRIRCFEAVCDAAHYAGAGAAGVIYGPAGDGLHGLDEFVTVDSLVEAAKVIAATTIDWCGTK